MSRRYESRTSSFNRSKIDDYLFAPTKKRKGKSSLAREPATLVVEGSKRAKVEDGEGTESEEEAEEAVLVQMDLVTNRVGRRGKRGA